MKTPEEYLKDVDWMDKWVWTIEAEAEEIIKQAQKDAYNQALEDAYRQSEVRIEYDSVRKDEPNGFSDDKIWIRDNDGSGCNFYVDKNSILKLKIK